MKKLCIKCQQVKDHSVRKTGKPASYCKDCQNEYTRAHYKANKEARISHSAKTTADHRAAVRDYLNELKDVPCADCGNRFIAPVMEFDHVRGEKMFQISKAGRYGWDKIKEEISKCDIVCANCHRIRTVLRNPEYWGI